MSSTCGSLPSSYCRSYSDTAPPSRELTGRIQRPASDPLHSRPATHRPCSFREFARQTRRWVLGIGEGFGAGSHSYGRRLGFPRRVTHSGPPRRSAGQKRNQRAITRVSKPESNATTRFGGGTARAATRGRGRPPSRRSGTRWRSAWKNPSASRRRTRGRGPGATAGSSPAGRTRTETGPPAAAPAVSAKPPTGRIPRRRGQRLRPHAGFGDACRRRADAERSGPRGDSRPARWSRTMAQLGVEYDILSWEGDILRLAFRDRAFEIRAGAAPRRGRGRPPSRCAACWESGRTPGSRRRGSRTIAGRAGRAPGWRRRRRHRRCAGAGGARAG